MFDQKNRRTVWHSAEIGFGGRPLLWAYGVKDLAQLFGITPRAVRGLADRRARGFDPYDLESVCREWARREGLLK